MKRFLTLSLTLFLTMLFACLFSMPAFAGGCDGCHALRRADGPELSQMLVAVSANVDADRVLHAEKGVIPQPPDLPVRDVSAQRMDYSPDMVGIDGPCVSWMINVSHQHQRV